MTVVPGRAGSAAVTDVDGPVGDGDVVVEGIAVGICGTDREITGDEYGSAPEGSEQLVLGHELAAPAPAPGLAVARSAG